MNMTLNEVILELEKMVGSDKLRAEEKEAVLRAILYLMNPLGAAVEKGQACKKESRLRLVDLDKLMAHPSLHDHFDEDASEEFIRGWKDCKQWIKGQRVIEVG